MAQLYFRYSTMNAGKSIEVLKIAHKHKVVGKHPVVLLPVLGDRTGDGYVSSRMGVQRKADLVFDSSACLYLEIFKLNPDCVLVDEAQFLTKEQVIDLARIVDNLNIPVICYGLKDDFKKELFEGSKWLLVYADEIEEVKAICWCGKKATCNARVVDGIVQREGPQVLLDTDETRAQNIRYVPLCRKHYMASVAG